MLREVVPLTIPEETTEILATLFMATTHDYLKDEAMPFVRGICSHFVLLCTLSRQPNTSQMLELQPSIIVDAIATVPSPLLQLHTV